MTVRLSEVVAHLDSVLEIERFRDYGPNGLQIEGAAEIERVVTGVSACMELFDAAIERDADLVVVHHGLIWGGGLPRVTGPTARRLSALLSNGISLAAYHLPLDKHPALGNNTGLADALGLGPERSHFGDVRGHALGLAGTYETPRQRAEVVQTISERVLDGDEPSFVFPYGPDQIRKVGLCTGAASDLLEEAAAHGCDMFVTGELAERSFELAKELQVTVVAAGHYATEVFGPIRLAGEIARAFPTLECEFVGVPSPL